MVAINELTPGLYLIDWLAIELKLISTVEYRAEEGAWLTMWDIAIFTQENLPPVSIRIKDKMGNFVPAPPNWYETIISKVSD